MITPPPFCLSSFPDIKPALIKRLRKAEQQLQALARRAETVLQAKKAGPPTQLEDEEWTVVEQTEELKRAGTHMVDQALLRDPDRTLRTKLVATVEKLRARLKVIEQQNAPTADFYVSDDSD